MEFTNKIKFECTNGTYTLDLKAISKSNTLSRMISETLNTKQTLIPIPLTVNHLKYFDFYTGFEFYPPLNFQEMLEYYDKNKDWPVRSLDDQIIIYFWILKGLCRVSILLKQHMRMTFILIKRLVSTLLIYTI